MAGEKKVKEIVIDASVAVKWFNPEKLSHEALELRNKHVKNKIHFYAPELLLYEVINALRWNSEFNEGDILKASKSLIDLMIIYQNLPLEKAVKLAYQYGLTIYDSAYIALANNLGGILVTADDKLYKQAQDEKCIVLLEDY